MEPSQTTLIQLMRLQQRCATAMDTRELEYIALNETFGLAEYRQAVLWTRNGGVRNLSGMTQMESNTPYVQWLNAWLPTQQHRHPKVVHAADINPEQAEAWPQFWPQIAVLLPLNDAGNTVGYLILARDQAWSQQELSNLKSWADFWSGHYRLQHGFKASNWQALKGLFQQRKYQVLGAIALLVCALLPVRLSVLAPASIVPLDPYVIRAPRSGLIESIDVAPNKHVEKSQSLLRIDDMEQQGQLDNALAKLNTLQTEYRGLAQDALYNTQSKARLINLRGAIAEQEALIKYLRAEDDQATVLAPQNGIAIFNDTLEWLGRPVQIGEKIMLLADPDKLQFEAWLDPSDTIPLTLGSTVTFFPDADPSASMAGQLSYVAFEAETQASGLAAYRVRAQLTVPVTLASPMGISGTIKLNGERVTLWYWLTRKPLAQLRAWLGI